MLPSSDDPTDKVHLNRERALLQELGCANARLLQLERTIKWWSECTSTWREKWGRVRIQRNELRDECKVLKGRNDALIVEFQKLKTQNEMFWSEIEKLRLEKRTAVVGPLVTSENSLMTSRNQASPGNSTKTYNEGISIVDVPPNNADIGIGEFERTKPFEYNKNERRLLTGTERISSGNDRLLTGNDRLLIGTDRLLTGSRTLRAAKENFSFPGFLEDMIFIENLLSGDDMTAASAQVSPSSSSSRTKTDHVTNAIIMEKLSKLKDYVKSCESYMSTKESESELLKASLLQLQESKSNTERKFEELKEQSFIQSSTETENGDPTTEKKLRDLHSEIERLQIENCLEWTKREKCESDMAEMKRQLRQTQQNKTELEEEVAKKTEELRISHETSQTLLGEELEVKSKELLDTKALYNKSRRQLLEKVDELNHEKNRTEHLDSEVKRLRTRIDELKEEVLQAEENIDHKGNEIRRLQRTIEEQVGQIENLQDELKRASMRFKRQSMILTAQSEESISDES